MLFCIGKFYIFPPTHTHANKHKPIETYLHPVWGFFPLPEQLLGKAIENINTALGNSGASVENSTLFHIPVINNRATSSDLTFSAGTGGRFAANSTTHNFPTQRLWLLKPEEKRGSVGLEVNSMKENLLEKRCFSSTAIVLMNESNGKWKNHKN